MDERCERHERQFQGVWVCPELVEAHASGELSSTEVLLLIHITSYAKNGKDGRGCYASNDFLGKLIGRCEIGTANIITKLKNKKWIRVSGFDGRRRFLITRLNTHFHNDGSRNHEGRVHEIMKAGFTKTRGQGSRNHEHNIYKYNNKSIIGEDLRSFASVPKKTFEQICAKKLEEALKKKRKFLPNSNLNQWPAEFLNLMKHLPKERIKKALLWYCQNIGGQYIPRAYSAKAFCQKFLNIEDQMPAEKKKFTLIPDCQKIYNSIKTDFYAKDQLEEILYTSWHNAVQFFKAFKKVKQLEGGIGPFAQHARKVFWNVESFVGTWMRDVQKELLYKKPVKIQVEHFVFDLKNPRTEKMGRALSMEYANTTDKWNDFVKAINENYETE